MAEAPKFIDAYLSGYTQRFHTHPELSRYGQSNASHQHGCTLLLLMLWPQASRELILATLTHDLGEFWVGDLAHHFKKAEPSLAARHAKIETTQRLAALPAIQRLDLSEKEYEKLKLVDQLEAYMFVKTVRPDIVLRQRWVELGASICAQARKLGVEERVKELIDDRQIH